MSTCQNCGFSEPDGVKFCGRCGAKMESAPSSSPHLPPVDLNHVKDKAQDLLTNTHDHSAAYEAGDIEANKTMAVLAYFGPLVFIPIFAANRSPYARFHANQGLMLFLAEILVAILGNLPLLGWLIALAGGFAGFVLLVVGVVNAGSGKAKDLPLIGTIRIMP